MIIDVLTLFPEMFPGVLNASILARAADKGALEVRLHDIREYSTNKHRKADGYPFGGGAGLIMSPQPVFDAVRDIDPDGDHPRIYMSPRGKLLDGETVSRLASEPKLLLLCGHYEGLDQRVIDHFGFIEISIGDYILTGGELPAMVLIDAVARMIPGVLGSEESHTEESIYSGLLEYPQYTRPADFEGLTVPETLTSGHHEAIRLWNFEQSLRLTLKVRPDLFFAYAEKNRDNRNDPPLSKAEYQILQSIIRLSG